MTIMYAVYAVSTKFIFLHTWVNFEALTKLLILSATQTVGFSEQSDILSNQSAAVCLT